jgi:hypothetical protein
MQKVPYTRNNGVLANGYYQKYEPKARAGDVENLDVYARRPLKPVFDFKRKSFSYLTRASLSVGWCSTPVLSLSKYTGSTYQENPIDFLKTFYRYSYQFVGGGN